MISFGPNPGSFQWHKRYHWNGQPSFRWADIIGPKRKLGSRNWASPTVHRPYGVSLNRSRKRASIQRLLWTKWGSGNSFPNPSRLNRLTCKTNAHFHGLSWELWALPTNSSLKYMSYKTKKKMVEDCGERWNICQAAGKLEGNSKWESSRKSDRKNQQLK